MIATCRCWRCGCSRAGLKHSLVDANWPAFEQVFFGFDPEKVVLMGAEHLERLDAGCAADPPPG